MLCEEYDHFNVVGCVSASRKGQIHCIFITILHCPTSPGTEKLLWLRVMEIDGKERTNAWMQIFKLQDRFGTSRFTSTRERIKLNNILASLMGKKKKKKSHKSLCLLLAT